MIAHQGTFVSLRKNWDPFDLENADLGTGWHIRLLVQTWRNEIAKRMELTA